LKVHPAFVAVVVLGILVISTPYLESWGLVTGWLLASLVVVGSLGGVGPVAGSSLGSLVVVGSSFGATHPWVVLSALGMVMVAVPL